MKNKRELGIALLWIIAYLLIIDIGINIILPYPDDPRNISPSILAQFFEYGRSVEGKLAWMTRKSDEESAPILLTGWLNNSRVKNFSTSPDSETKPTITVYGMSHSVQLAEDMAKIDNSFAVRSFGAPGAVPSWSYAAFLVDQELRHSEVVVLAVMTRGVPLIGTTSGMTNHFDSIWPYTYPRFIETDGTLTQEMPPFTSLEGYREYFYDSEKWNSYVSWLRQYDKFYDPLLFKRTFLDKSSIFRMLRRGYAYSSRSKKEAKVYNDKTGFNPKSEEVLLLRLLIEHFAEAARKSGSLPIVYIVNNVFMSDHLFRILEPTLVSHKILFLSTHDICPPNDPQNYVPNSHFTPSKNMELAQAMMKIIRENTAAIKLEKNGNRQEHCELA
jgi:hypothetical protein